MFLSIPKRPVDLAKAKFNAADIEEMAARMEPSIAKAITAALQDQADSLDIDALAEALQGGDLAKVMSLIKPAGAAFGGAMDTLAEATWAGAALEMAMPIFNRIEFHFDKLNPVLVQWLQTYRLNLIREMDDKTLTGIRRALIEGQRLGKNPRVTARHIKQIVGLTDRQQAAVGNFRKELEGFHARRSAAGWNLGAKIDRANGFQVLKPDANGDPGDGIKERRLRDFRHDGALKRAMDSGKPLKPEQIDKMVDAYARKYRKYRGETIARTESMRAANMGVQEAWRQAVTSGKVPETLVRRFWKVAKDERTCKICAPIPKLNPKGVTLGMPFATPKGPIFLGPVHPDCRCFVFIRLMEPAELGMPQF